MFGLIQTSQIGGQSYRDTSPYKVSILCFNSNCNPLKLLEQEMGEILLLLCALIDLIISTKQVNLIKPLQFAVVIKAVFSYVRLYCCETCNFEGIKTLEL